MSKTKSASASGGLCPLDSLTRGSAPGPCWGLCPQTLVTGSRYHARHGAMPPRYGKLEPPLRDGSSGHWTLSYIEETTCLEIQSDQPFIQDVH